jgi:hypothetical protein
MAAETRLARILALRILVLSSDLTKRCSEDVA